MVDAAPADLAIWRTEPINGFEVEEGRGRRYTRSNFFPLFTFFFSTYFLQECNIVLKIHAKKVILFATFIFRENAPSRQSEVIQLLNEFCRIGVAYSLRNFRAITLSFKEEAKRRCRAGVQVHISYRYRTLHRCI